MKINDIGISGKLDFPRIRKLLLIGLIASILHLAGDFILGWGVEDETQEGLLRLFSVYASASDGRIFAAALLGLFGMVLEGLCMFGIYRLMADGSPKCAHAYRSGIFGYMAFGACGYHVPFCAAAFLLKHGFAEELVVKFAAYFILPAFILFWIFFLALEIAQIRAFSKGYTPYPKYAWIFCMPIGMAIAVLVGLIGNYPFTNAVFCAWIALGNVWTFGGLLLTLKNAKGISETNAK